MHKNDSFRHHFGICVFIATAMVSCQDHLEPDVSSPAYQITQSEQLIIPTVIDLPPDLPGGNSRVATYFAEGVQKYKAQQKTGSNPVTYEWVFVAPEANLYDGTNVKIGTHFAGPS